MNTMSCNVTSYICQKVIIIEYWIRQSSRKERTIEGHVRYKVGLYRENGTRYRYRPSSKSNGEPIGNDMQTFD